MRIAFSTPVVAALALGGIAALALLPPRASAQPGYYWNPSASFGETSADSSPSSFYGGPRGRRYLVAAAQDNHPLTVVAVRAPRADDPAEAHAAPGTMVAELADPRAAAAPGGTTPDLRVAVNADRAAVLTPGSTLRPRLLGGDGVQLLAGQTLVAFVPTPAEGSGLDDVTRTRS